MERKRRPNFTSDELEVLVAGVDTHSKVRQWDRRLIEISCFCRFGVFLTLTLGQQLLAQLGLCG